MQQTKSNLDKREAAFLNSTMSENGTNEDLTSEIGRKNFIRAAQIAASLNLPEDRIKDIQLDALWQIAVSRNAFGTEILAKEYGISKRLLKQYLEEKAKQMREKGDTKALMPCYDVRTGKYLSFEEWIKYYTPMTGSRGLVPAPGEAWEGTKARFEEAMEDIKDKFRRLVK